MLDLRNFDLYGFAYDKIARFRYLKLTVECRRAKLMLVLLIDIQMFILFHGYSRGLHYLNYLRRGVLIAAVLSARISRMSWNQDTNVVLDRQMLILKRRSL